jgi:hypothetical protein
LTEHQDKTSVKLKKVRVNVNDSDSDDSTQNGMDDDKDPPPENIFLARSQDPVIQSTESGNNLWVL